MADGERGGPSVKPPFEIPDFSLVVLIGPTGSGKSSFARRHFKETEIVSSDAARAIVSDDETDQSATTDAFDLVHHTAGLRLKNRRLTVIDSTAARKPDRGKLIALGRAWHAPVVGIVLNIDPKICHARNQERPNRKFGESVPRNHSREIRKSLRSLRKEGFVSTIVLDTPAAADALEVVRRPLWTDKRDDAGPFDIIGDVHGCFEELSDLLTRLGYAVGPYEDGETPLRARHPGGRRALFVGDLCDRGPRNRDVLRLVMGMVEAGDALCVMGNHDFKLARWLRGKDVTRTHGLDLTLAELEACSDDFRKKARGFVDDLRSHYWLDEGRLVVAHAGLKEEMHGRGSGAVRQFAMFGDTTGEVDSFGLPVRRDWARGYRGAAAVVYGHTPTRDAEWLNETICIDTGCVFGGSLTALRWPEKTLERVEAREKYAEPARPLDGEGALTAQQEHDKILYFDDLMENYRVVTRFQTTVRLDEGHMAAALEVMGRHAIDPRWLIYLPPTMAPAPTAPDGPYLERPQEAMDYFAEAGVTEIIAEEKHMGSRALAVVARDADAALKRFGVEDGKAGVVYTRTGRPFFQDEAMEAALVARIAAAAERAGLFDALDSAWLLLDAELTPWSAKAGQLLKTQYGPTATAARAASDALADALAGAAALGETDPDFAAFVETARRRAGAAEQFEAAILRYCWDAPTLEEHRFAPFHLLAAEGRVFDDAPNDWHMAQAERLAEQDPILLATGWRRFSTGDPEDRAALDAWWAAHTEAGGEGFVLKPPMFRPEGRVQPAMKVRGRDYLRIIYGPDYDAPGSIDRLRQRGLGRKWSLALREFRLGLEGLHRFVEGAPLMKVHECAVGVLGLESEPVDPRL